MKPPFCSPPGKLMYNSNNVFSIKTTIEGKTSLRGSYMIQIISQNSSWIATILGGDQRGH